VFPVSLFSYFFAHIFKSRTRQKLILLAIIGLLISSFSLAVLQGVMGGLQNGLIKRSKNVHGKGYIDITRLAQAERDDLVLRLNEINVDFVPELELEMMVQSGNFISPIVLHGMDFKTFVPKFLENKDKTHLVIGSDLGRKLRSFYGSKLLLTSPSHLSLIFQEVPMQSSIYISDFFSSELPEIDSLHGWVRLSFLQNMIRKKTFNKFRIYSDSKEEIFELINKYNLNVNFVSWEEQNSTLVRALNLETRVMLFLFVGMSFLIGICITSGFLIFYNKVKIDLASFWILGLSRESLLKLVYWFGQFITVFFCLLGVLLALAFLILLDTNQFILMPEHFVERNIPVKIDFFSMLISFLVPYFVASLFTHYTFKIFKRENNSFVSLIRKVSH
jgi:lipoprotein-releasing system permease protein